MLRRRSIIFSFITISLFLTPSSHSQGVADYRIFSITFNTSSPSRLAVDRGRLAWKEHDVNSGLELVRYYSGADIITLDSNLVDVIPSLSRRYVVWNTHDELAKAYDQNDGTTFVLGTSYNPDNIQPVSVHNRFAVYARRKAATGSSIVLHRFADGSDTLLSTALWNTQPSVHQGQIAWVSADSVGTYARSAISFFDGRSSSTISGASPARNRSPIVRDGQVAWLKSDSGGTSVQLFTGDTALTLIRTNGPTQACTGYDLSDGMAVAALTDTAASTGLIAIYDAERRTLTAVADSHGVWSPHISNGLVVWQSGTGVGSQAREYDIATSLQVQLGGAENPVIDHDMIAWTYGDAVELRRFVSYQQLTNDGMNGWEQTKFKTIDSSRVIWGNFANALHMRMFSWDGNAVRRLSDSTGDRDLVMANDGYAVWRLDADSLFYYDWASPPVKFLDSIQAENPYTAGGYISFFGVKLTNNDPVKYPWLYDIKGNRLIQLSKDSVNAGTVLCNGNSACWENLATQRLMFYDGALTSTISDSAIVGDYVYRKGLILWTQVRGGVAQVFSYDVASKSTTQLTSGGGDKYRPMTDGRAITWFENSVFNATYVDADLVYLSESGSVPVRIHHVPSRTTFWKWMSDGKLAWVSNGNVVVFDGKVISEIAEGSGFFLNDAHTDKGFVEWRRMFPPPAQDSGNVFIGPLIPHVSFDAVNITGAAPLAVTFSNRSWEGDRSYLWEFGDGATSTTVDPVHLYSLPGTYSVTLTATGLTSAVSEKKHALVRVSSLNSLGSPAAPFPMETELLQNYPNPFNPLTVIKYTVGGVRGQGLGVSDVSLVVYDILGREIRMLVNERKAPGSYEASFDGSGLSSGVYIYRLKVGPPDRQAGSFVASRQMVLIK